MVSNATVGLVFVVTVQLLVFLSATAAVELYPGSQLVNFQGSLFSGNGTISSRNLTTDLPASEGTVQPPDGIFYTDSFSSIKGWLTKIPGSSFLYNVVMSPYVLLSYTGMPQSFVYGLGSFWYLIMFFVFVAFFWGRE